MTRAQSSLPSRLRLSTYFASSQGARFCQQRRMMRCPLKASARKAAFAAVELHLVTALGLDTLLIRGE